jgi:hypothetical protein
LRVDFALDLAHALKRTTGRGEALLAIGVAPGALRLPLIGRWHDGIVIAAYDDGDQPKQVVVCPKIVQPPITVIIGGRALLMLIAARFSGSGSGKDLLSRATSLIAFGLLPFCSFPIPVASRLARIEGRDRPACRIPCARRGMAHRVRPQ